MQIDRFNIAQHFQTISDHLKKASFISFDCEFTGLVTNLQKIEGLYPDHRQFYQRIKETALNFKILQLGLTAFIYNDKEQAYEPHTYNFYTLPFVNVEGFNNVMIAEVESLQFLSKHGINWNNVFEKGIAPQRLLKPFNYQRHRYDQLESKQKREYYFSEQDRKIVNNIEEKLQKIASTHSSQKINFEKDSIFSYFHNKYYSRIIKKKDKKTTKKYEYIVEILNQAQKQDQIVFQKMENGLQTGENKVQVKNDSKFSIENLLQIIIQNHIPLIGYYPSLDLGLIYHTYFQALPETFQQFCVKISKLFPHIYDVKILSKPVQAKFKGLKVNIKSLYLACFDPKTLAPYANISIQQAQKQLQKSKSHEAGYDAYITGCAFIGMVNFLTKNDQRKPVNLQEFQKITGMTNILYSKFTGQIILRYPHCKNSISNQQRILIWNQTKGNEKYKQIAQKLSKYGSLCVQEDHGQVYFVYEEENQKINIILEEFQKEYGLRDYSKRKIARARNMYTQSYKQLYLNE